MSKTQVRETIYSSEYFTWDGGLAKFVAEISNWASAVPVGHEAQIKIESEGGYEGCHSCVLAVYYMRDETDIEAMERVAAQENWNRRNDELQRRTYEALKRKFEPAK